MNRSRISILLCVVMGATVGLATGLWWLWPPVGVLDVVSSPTGAEVRLDRHFRGVTPCVLAGIPRGDHELRVSHAGYHDDARTVAVCGGRITLRVELRRLSPGAVLILRSDPTGAYVWLDGAPGRETPARFESVPPGPHHVKIEKPGWVTHEETVIIAGSDEKVISVKLTSSQVAYFREAIRRDPGDPANYVALGRLLVRYGDLDEAFDMLPRAMQAHTETQRPLDKSLREFTAALRLGAPDPNDPHWTKLSQDILDWLRQGPLNDSRLQAIHAVYSLLDHWRGMESLASFCLSAGKPRPDFYAWRALARLHLGEEDLFRADVDSLTGLIRSLSPKPPPDREFCQALQDEARWTELVRFCDAYLDGPSQDVLLRVARMTAVDRLGDLARFQEDFSNIFEHVRRRPYLSADVYALRRALLTANKPAELLSLCDVLLTAKPCPLLARLWHTEALFRAKRWEQVLDGFPALLAEEAISPTSARLRPQDAPEACIAVLWTAAWAMMELGKTDSLNQLIAQYEPAKDQHPWIDVIRGELWCRQPEGDPPKRWLDAKPCQTRPRIDGRLDDEAWTHAGRSSNFLDLYTATPNEEHTTILASYDHSSLYLGIIGHIGRREGRARPGPTALDQMPEARLELFLDVHRDYSTYRQFMFSAGGLRRELDCCSTPFDRHFLIDESYAPKYTLATSSDGNEDSYELELPFTSLGAKAARPGTVWGFNLIHMGIRSTSFIRLGTDSYHCPLRFAFLRFR